MELRRHLPSQSVTMDSNVLPKLSFPPPSKITDQIFLIREHPPVTTQMICCFSTLMAKIGSPVRQ